MTQCSTKTRVDFHPDLPVDVTFDAPEISSDGGLTLLRRADEQLGLTDERQQAKVEHTRLGQLRQRVDQQAGSAATYRLVKQRGRTLQSAGDQFADDLGSTEHLDEQTEEQKRRTLDRLHALARAEFGTLRTRL